MHGCEQKKSSKILLLLHNSIVFSASWIYVFVVVCMISKWIKQWLVSSCYAWLWTKTVQKFVVSVCVSVVWIKYLWLLFFFLEKDLSCCYVHTEIEIERENIVSPTDTKNGFTLILGKFHKSQTHIHVDMCIT